MTAPNRDNSFASFFEGPFFYWLFWSLAIGGTALGLTGDLAKAGILAGAAALALMIHSFWLKVRLDSRWLIELQSFLIRMGALPEGHRVRHLFLPWQVPKARREFLASTLDGAKEIEKKLHETRHALDKFVGTKGSQFASKYASRSDWGGEGALVYALFADVRGFTRMAERLKPSETVTFLNRLFSSIEEVIREAGGEVNKYMGDAILAYFPQPPDEEGPAVKRVLMCTLRMLSRFFEIDAKYKHDYSVIPDVGFGVGVASGPVILGNIGSMNRMEFTLIGDTVNVASRLCSIAEPGQILVTAEVAKAAEGMFRMEALGAVKLKGKTDPITPYVVLGEKLQPGLA